MLAHVGAWKASGVSRKSYCMAHGLGLHTMAYWCAKVRREQMPGGFVPPPSRRSGVNVRP